MITQDITWIVMPGLLRSANSKVLFNSSTASVWRSPPVPCLRASYKYAFQNICSVQFWILTSKRGWLCLWEHRVASGHQLSSFFPLQTHFLTLLFEQNTLAITNCTYRHPHMKLIYHPNVNLVVHGSSYYSMVNLVVAVMSDLNTKLWLLLFLLNWNF